MIEDGWQRDIVDKKRRMAAPKLAMRRIGNQITWQPCAGCQLCKYVNTLSLYFFQDVFVFSFVFLVRSCECELCGNSIVQIASFMTLAPLRHFEVEDFGISGSASQLLMTIFPCLLDLPDDHILWIYQIAENMTIFPCLLDMSDDQILWMPMRLLYHIAEKMNIFRIFAN